MWTPGTSITPASASPHRRLAGILPLLVALALLAGCAGGGAPAAPTAKPAAPAPPTTAPAASASGGPAAASPAAPAASGKPAAVASPAAAAPAAGAPASGKPPVELWMGLITNLNYGPFFVGVEKGIFLKHGIDLKLRVFSTAVEPVKALQAGEVQVSVGTWSGTAPAIVQGADFKMWTMIVSEPNNVNYDGYNGIIVRPGLNNVNKVEDLKGLRVGVPSGSGVHTYLLAQLAKANVPADAVTILNITLPNYLAALQSNNIDAAVTGEPYGVMLQQRLPGSKFIVRSGSVMNGRITGITMTAWLDKNPELAERLWAGTAEASQYIRQNPDASAEAVSHALPGFEAPLVREALKYMSFDPRYSSKIEQAFANETRLLIEQKKMTGEPKIAEVVAVDLMRNLQKKYPQYFSDLPPVVE